MSGLFALWLGLDPPASHSQEDPFEAERNAERRPKVLLVEVVGIITPGLSKSLQREVRKWRQEEPAISYIIFRLDTPGGELQSATDIANFISLELKDVRTIAFIPPGKYALSAGALIAVSANEIVMGENSQIGAAQPLQLKVVDPYHAEWEEAGEKIESVVRSSFRMHASNRGYPVVFTDAMVTKKRGMDIVRVEFREPDGKGNFTIRPEFMPRSDYDNLPPRRKADLAGDRGNLETVLRDGQLLVMDHRMAKDYGFVKHFADDRSDLLLKLNINVGPENIIDSSTGALKSHYPALQAVVNFLNHSLVRFVLILGGFLGLLLEVKMLGTFVPGTIGLACFAIFFGASLLPVSGSVAPTATIWEVLVFLLGLVLVGLEFFVAPGTAVFALTGAALCVVSMVLAMVPPANSGTGQLSIADAIVILVYGFGLGGVTFLIFLRYLPQSSFLARRGLVSHGAITGVPTAANALEAQAQWNEIIGKKGVVLGGLRPAGKVELEGGKLLDVVADGEFIEDGTRVRVVECDGPRIVVTRVTE